MSNYHIKYQFDESHLSISALNLQTRDERRIERGFDDLSQLGDLTVLYRALVTLRSFAEEDDERVISLAKKLGEEVYKLYFLGLEDFLDAGSHLFLEHSEFLLPLELAYDGAEFIGLKYSVGNWLQKFGQVEWAESQSSAPLEPSEDFKVLLLGNESEAVAKVFSWSKKRSLCESLTSTWSDSLLLRLNSNRYSVLHFACHGHYDESDPENSFLVLDNQRAGKNYAALLSLRELKKAKLSQTPLVFLNACHSGKVEPNYVGFVGFAGRLLQSGARNCITTLWTISDSSASRFASIFYSCMLEGQPIGLALREARLECWSDKRDVLTSLSYVLFGDPASTFKAA